MLSLWVRVYRPGYVAMKPLALGVLGLFTGLVIDVGVNTLFPIASSPHVQAATAQEPPLVRTPKCLKERRMHAYGTYRASSYQRADTDLPIDLTITECLEWEVLPP